MARRNLVLEQMLEQGYLNKSQYEEAIAQALPAPKDIQPPHQILVESVDAGYFVNWVSQQIIERYGATRAFTGGLTIRTTLDLNLQHAAEEAIDGYLPGPEGPSASLVAIENSTGEVRAMVGGRNFNETPFNLATEGERQPGSSFKAFDLAAALQAGISPDSVWSSREKTFIVSGTHGKEKFVVHNDEGNYTGSNTLTNATAYSDNSIYAEVGLKVGTTHIAHLAHRMGITTPISTNPAMTIGGLNVGVTPLDMAHAYETIAHGGDRVSGTLVSESQPVGIQEVAASGSSTLPDGHHHDVEHAVLTRGAAPRSRRNGDLDARDRAAVRHRPRRRARHVRRGQDRHDLQLRRCLVRRLEQEVHRRRLGGLPQQARPHDHAVRRRPRARRHLPRAHLARLHGLRHAARKGTRRTDGRQEQTLNGRERHRHGHHEPARIGIPQLRLDHGIPAWDDPGLAPAGGTSTPATQQPAGSTPAGQPPAGSQPSGQQPAPSEPAPTPSPTPTPAAPAPSPPTPQSSGGTAGGTAAP